MKRLIALIGIQVIVGLAAAPGLDAAEPDVVESSPNILLIVTDDQRAGTFGTMPQTKAWFGEGAKYTNAFASTPLCCPSRGSILTGRYAHNHGVTRNDGRLLDHSTTITRYLHDAGYTTGIFGKFINHWPLKQTPPYFDNYGVVDMPSDHRDDVWNINGIVQSIRTYGTRVVQDLTKDFIVNAEADDAKPWFAYVTPHAPHKPFVPQRKYKDLRVPKWRNKGAVEERSLQDKPPWLQDRACDLACGRTKRRQQLRMLASVDDMVGTLRDTIEQYGETDTLVIYTSDNGLLWGDHGLRSKSQPYLPSSKIPLLVRGPEVPAGVTTSDLVLNLDLAATVLDAAGVSPPPDAPPLDGRSLLSEAPPRDRVLLEHWCTGKSCPYWRSTTTPTYQYVERYNSDGDTIFTEYYDLVEDPWQLRNLFGDRLNGNEPDTDPLHAQLEADASCSGNDCP